MEKVEEESRTMQTYTFKKITTAKHKKTEGASLKRMAYELAEAMLSEHTNTWKLAFEEYLYNKASTRNERSLHDF